VTLTRPGGDYYKDYKGRKRNVVQARVGQVAQIVLHCNVFKT
jgi:hypothetical protein